MARLITNLVVPTERELSAQGKLSCTQPGCKSSFQCSSNLTMHLVKHHKLAELKSAGANYACPVNNCNRNSESNKFFKSIKLLKQHYLKCHCAKTHQCPNCPKAFAKEYLLRVHTKSCGKTFVCSCGWQYSTREALLTHCKRKSHSPTQLESDENGLRDRERTSSGLKEIRRKGEEKLVQVCIASTATNDGHSNEVTVIPTHYVAAIALSELATTFIIPKNCTTSVQTMAAAETRASKTTRYEVSTQETQTGVNKKISTETQTNHVVNGKACHKCAVEEKRRRRSTETQTKQLMSFLAAVKDETMDCLNDPSLSDAHTKPTSSRPFNEYSVWNTAEPDAKSYSTLSTHNETSSHCLSSFDKLCNNETQTEIDWLFESEVEGVSTAETQTTDDLIEDLYSHMCTQTTDLFDFNLVDTSDNQTQTAWPDM